LALLAIVFTEPDYIKVEVESKGGVQGSRTLIDPRATIAILLDSY